MMYLKDFHASGPSPLSWGRGKKNESKKTLVLFEYN